MPSDIHTHKSCRWYFGRTRFFVTKQRPTCIALEPMVCAELSQSLHAVARAVPAEP